ncbi:MULTISPECIES: GNAT family N-acetyltransferase [Methylomonas]|uniref:N-acetyltransferase domain-containing protein n=2 Tax=Methylomonas TaxID=416 RepID=A0A140E3Y7_9GAMM|nr:MULTISPECIES: GNAT family N-acetyltransferase [Methylomonas]AMK75111.1 hypothetical protein JT25_001200 [Methylomonas denitrificans]OAI02601.1 hypothetical protein A1342_02190 [Methylomonas methanica]TCV83073.1 L-amino acid N-acyltransferase YncA [Methylomonas methanica]
MPNNVCQQLNIRHAKLEDAMDVLRWRNDPIVCAMSRQNEPISEAAHMSWYSGVLDNSERLLLIGVLNKKKVGAVRFDYVRESTWEVNIAIAPELRGQGLGRKLLKLALTTFYVDHASESVSAVVRLNNEPSLKLFSALGFKQESHSGEFSNLVLTVSH